MQVCLAIYVCLSGLWLGGLLHLSFLSDFLKLVCYAHVFPCTCISIYMYVYMLRMYMQVGVLQVLVSALNMYVKDLRERSEERGTVYVMCSLHAVF